jgi:ankyrin repeat protein
MKPLHVYTLYNNLNEQILDLFLKNGADINGIDMYGETPLHYAYMQGNKKIIDLLLKKGADMNIKNKQGKIPKHV